MPNHDNIDEQISRIDALFAQAEQSDEFWISKAKFKFTEELLAIMQQQEMKKGDLAGILGVKPAQISRLCSGNNNFTIGTMVRIARALNCELLTHLQPAGSNCMWINFLDQEPARQQPDCREFGEYKTIGGIAAIESSARNEVFAAS